MRKPYITFLVLFLALNGCSALGIQTKVEEGRQKALDQLDKIACSDTKETEAAVKGGKLEKVDWVAICAGE